MSQKSGARFTERQGHYLAFIHTYSYMFGKPRPVLAVSPPSVHQMIVTLERLELVSRVPGQPRTIKVTLADDELPRLQPIKTTATRY